VKSSSKSLLRSKNNLIDGGKSKGGSKKSSRNQLNASTTLIAKQKRDNKGSKSMMNSNVDVAEESKDELSSTPLRISLTASKESSSDDRITSKPTSNPSKKSSLAASKEPSASNIDQIVRKPTSNPSKKSSLAASKEPSASNIDQIVSKPTSKKSSLAASKEPSAVEIEQVLSKPTSKKSSLSASKEPSASNIDQIVSKPTSKKSSLAASKEPSAIEIEQVSSKPTSKKNSLAASKEPSAAEIGLLSKPDSKVSILDDIEPKSGSTPPSGLLSLVASKEPSFLDTADDNGSSLHDDTEKHVKLESTQVNAENETPGSKNSSRKHSPDASKESKEESLDVNPTPKLAQIQSKITSKESVSLAIPKKTKASQLTSRNPSRITSKAPSFKTSEDKPIAQKGSNIAAPQTETKQTGETIISDGIIPAVPESDILRETILENSADASKKTFLSRFSRASLSSIPMLDTIADTPEEAVSPTSAPAVEDEYFPPREELDLLNIIDQEFKEAQQADSARPKKVVWFKCFLKGESRILVVDQHASFGEFKEQAVELFFGVYQAGQSHEGGMKLSPGHEMDMFYMDVDSVKCRLDETDSFDAAISISNKLNRPFVSIFCSVVDSNGQEVQGISHRLIRPKISIG
jgi:hypothetical protein